jgi:competence protein ComGC
MLAEERYFVKLNKGQAAVEYLVFFAVIAVLTLLSVCILYPRVHQASETGFQSAVEEMLR